MLYKNQYIIPIVGLALGEHEFEFKIEDEFLKEFETDILQTCDITLTLGINKTDNYYAFDYTFKGNVGVPCDRCTETYQQPIDCHYRLIVKHASEVDEQEEGDLELTFIDQGVTQLNIINDIYDYIMISLPFRKVHPEGECNEEIINYLENNKKSSEEAIDPRWEALSKLKK